MKYSTGALVLALAASSADAFGTIKLRSSSQSSFVPKNLPTTTTTTTRTSSQRRMNNDMSMLVVSSGGMLELEEMADRDSGVTKQIRKSPQLWKLAGYAAIPASAVLGFGLVPSRKLAAHAVGGVVSAVAGVVGQNKMVSMAESAAPSKIASILIEEGIENPKETAMKVQEVQEVFGVDPEDFTAMTTKIYAKYLVGMVKFSPEPNSKEISELSNVKESLLLDNIAVGEAHFMAAEDWYRETTLMTLEEDLEDPDSDEYKAMSKFLYLTDRALSNNNETPEAYKYELSRVARVFKLDSAGAQERIEEVVEPFYGKALKNARAKLGTGKVSAAMLERARLTLGVGERTASLLHEQTMNDEVRALLGLSEDEEKEEADLAVMKFPPGSVERLKMLAELLPLSQRDVEYEIKAEALPLFQASALGIMKDVINGVKSPEEAWEEMDARRSELLVAESDSKDLVSSLVMQSLGAPLEEANEYAQLGNDAAAYDRIVEIVEAKQAVMAVLAKSGWTEQENFDVEFCSPYDKKSVCGFLKFDLRRNLYMIYLRRVARRADEEGKITDEAKAKLFEVQGLLGIDENLAQSLYKSYFGQSLTNALERGMKQLLSDYSEELLEKWKKTVTKVIDDYKLSMEMVKSSGRNLYGEAVVAINKEAPGGIPTKEQIVALDGLRQFLQLEKQETYSAHSQVFGTKYQQSVEEAMSITGVIRPEFREPLEELRERLGLPESYTRSLFLSAVEERMRPMLEWIVSETEKTVLTRQQLAQKTGRDLGEDYFQSGKQADGVLGLGAEVNVMGDIMNLVDFYEENDIIEKRQVDVQLVKKTTKDDNGEEKEMEEEQPVYETIYPVTALGMRAVDSHTAELIYRQFVVGSFTAQTPQASRYEGARATFGGILGLTSEAMEDIGNNIGGTIYENYVSKSMAQKGTLDQQDIMFLAQMQAKLGLSPEQGEEMLMTAQKNVLSEEVSLLMEAPTAEEIKVFREKCNTLGINLEEDLGVTKQRLIKMFEIEVTRGMESKQITLESGDDVAEIQESLGLEPEETEKIFEDLVIRLGTDMFDRVVEAIKKGDQRESVPPLRRLVRYASFVDGDLGLEVDRETAEKIYDNYTKLDFRDEDEETIANSKQLLKTALSLS